MSEMAVKLSALRAGPPKKEEEAGYDVPVIRGRWL
jgi:hypothetical protein